MEMFHLKILHGDYDEMLETVFDVTFALSVIVFLSAFLVIYQWGFLENYSPAWKPVALLYPILPN